MSDDRKGEGGGERERERERSVCVCVHRGSVAYTCVYVRLACRKYVKCKNVKETIGRCRCWESRNQGGKKSSKEQKF
jgi:hypothetical protein